MTDLVVSTRVNKKKDLAHFRRSLLSTDLRGCQAPLPNTFWGYSAH